MMDKIEATLMAEGLHPRDVVWLEKRIEALEAALGEMVIASERLTLIRDGTRAVLAGDVSA